MEEKDRNIEDKKMKGTAGRKIWRQENGFLIFLP